MKESGHALLSAQDIMETRHVQHEEPMTIKDLHSARTFEENDPTEIVGTFLTSALKLLKQDLPDMLTHREHIPSGVLPPVSLTRYICMYSAFMCSLVCCNGASPCV